MVIYGLSQAKKYEMIQGLGPCHGAVVFFR